MLATLAGVAGVAGAAGLAVASAGCGGNDGAARVGSPTVVRVAVGSGPGAPTVATGFAVGAGRVVTVGHVLDARGAVRVAGTRARVVRVDRRLDLALLAVPGLPAAPATTARADGRVGVLVRRRGGVGGIAGAIRRHITARVRPRPGATPAVRPALELAAAIAAGDSGAPVVDARSHVAGVVFARSHAREGTAYAVDARGLAAFLDATRQR